MGEHTYAMSTVWVGSTGVGYRDYSREHSVTFGTAGDLTLSADPAFKGDAALPNPEVLLVAAASSCQLLSFLALAAREGLDVIEYSDDATGVMPVAKEAMSITRIALSPRIRLRGNDIEGITARVNDLSQQAHHQCYIANSLRTDVTVTPRVEVIP